MSRPKPGSWGRRDRSRVLHRAHLRVVEGMASYEGPPLVVVACGRLAVEEYRWHAPHGRGDRKCKICARVDP